MAEHYRFFNSTEEDVREYLAAEFAEYFSRFLSDGLYTEDGRAGLKVIPGDGLQVQVATGYAFVRGYMYHNDAALTLDLNEPDTMLDRIDRVVLRFDEVAREIRLTVKTGSFSSTPVAPGLEITNVVKEMGLARVFVRHGITSVNQPNITDERLTAACGLVSSLITIPAQEMWDVWNIALDGIEAAWTQQTTQIDAAWQQQTAQIDSEWDTQTSAIESTWDAIKANWQTWLESVQHTLGVRMMIGETAPPELQPGDLWFKVV
jgi:hypothetical protein